MADGTGGCHADATRRKGSVADRAVIDGLAVNGSAHSVGKLAMITRYLQTGMLYHYAMAIIIGLIGLLGWFVLRG